MDPISILGLVATLVHVLPQIAGDAQQTYALLTAGANAVRNAQAGDGTIAPDDWAALDSALNGDLARLHAAAQG